MSLIEKLQNLYIVGEIAGEKLLKPYKRCNQKLQNLYIDAEITGEKLLKPYKIGNQLVQHFLSGDHFVYMLSRKVAQAVIFFFLSSFTVTGMVIKYLHRHEITNYHEKIIGKMARREVVNDYPRQPYVLRLFSMLSGQRNSIQAEILEAEQNCERLACNIIRYEGNNVWVQLISRNQHSRWRKEEAQPFAW